MAPQYCGHPLSRTRPERGSYNQASSSLNPPYGSMGTSALGLGQDLSGLTSFEASLMPIDPSTSSNPFGRTEYSHRGSNVPHLTFDTHQNDNAIDLSLHDGIRSPWQLTRAVEGSDDNNACASLLHRYTSEEPGDPWNSVQATGICPDTRKDQAFSLRRQSLNLGGQHHCMPKSDHGSRANETDEGYHTLSVQSQLDAGSVYSAPQGDMLQGPQNKGLLPRSTPSSTPQASSGALLSDPSYYIQNAGSMSQQEFQPTMPSTFPCSESGCDWLGKTLSEFKKHVARHRREYTCQEPGCPRRIKGFATINDLERHQKTVHKIEPNHGFTRYYKCFAHSCSKRGKEWPRLDNFKQHLQRMHTQESTEELIKRSDQWYDEKLQWSSQTLASQAYTEAQSISLSAQRSAQDSLAAQPQTPQRLSRGWKPASYSGYPATPAPVMISHSSPGHLQSASTTTFHSWQASPTNMSTINVQVFQPTALTGHSAPSDNTSRNDDALNSSMHPLAQQQQTGHHQRSPLSYVNPSSLSQINASSTAARTAPESSVPPLDVRLSSEFSDIPTYQTYQDTHDFPVPGDHILAHLGSELNSQDHLNNMTDPSWSVSIKDRQTANGAEKTGQIDQSLDVSADAIQSFLRKLESKDNIERDSLTTSSLEEIIRAGIESLRGSSSTGSASKPTPKLCHVMGTSIASTSENGKTYHQCPYPKCKKMMHRQCDLKKHIKRHQRPYGCTFDKCHKVFGSKNDWKRHENMQHYQMECWRCGETERANGIERISCSKLFYRREHFTKHLSETHSIEDEGAQRELCKRQRLGRNLQLQYWCGFCRKIISMRKKGIEGSDERFNHIDDHFMKEKLDINNWLLTEGTLTKGQALENEEAQAREVRSSPESNDEDRTLQQRATRLAKSRLAASQSAQKRQAEEEWEDSSRTTRRQRVDGGSLSSKNRLVFAQCCQCGDGPVVLRNSSACNICQERFCQNCTYTDGTGDTINVRG